LATKIILHRRWLHVKYNTEMVSKLFQNNSISHVTTALHTLHVY